MAAAAMTIGSLEDFFSPTFEALGSIFSFEKSNLLLTPSFDLLKFGDAFLALASAVSPSFDSEGGDEGVMSDLMKLIFFLLSPSVGDLSFLSKFTDMV
jgi:hypothetical protein